MEGVLDTITIWLGAFVTLAVFSYLIKDNAVYRMVQNAALGVAVGTTIVILWNQTLAPRWLERAWHGWQAIQANTESYAGAHWTDVFWIFAILPGSLWYFQLTRKYFWLSTLISGFFIGVAAGIAFKAQILLVVPQIAETIAPLLPINAPEGMTWWEWFYTCLDRLIIVVVLLASLFYFFFSVKVENPVAKGVLRFGRISIMVTLGAMFGNTVMTRVAYLIERLLFLYVEWFNGEILARIFPQ